MPGVIPPGASFPPQHSAPVRRISPFRLQSEADVAKQVADAEAAANTLPPDVLDAWHQFGTAMGISLPESINRASAYRRAFHHAVR